MALKSLWKPFGTKSLQRFVQDGLSALRQSPILLITSSVAATAAHKPIADACQWVQFTLSQQFGLRTVSATISSAFVSPSFDAELQELWRRTGASSIVAVGSGAAMDLAKLLAKQKSVEQVVLVPCTLGATMAAGASHTLLLDPLEETLVVAPSHTNNESLTRITTVPLDSNYTANTVQESTVLQACLAISLDACLRQSPHPNLEVALQELHRILLLLQNEEQVVDHNTMMNLCYQVGTLISYGLGNEDRSAPLALAASLIPPLFPHVHILSFWASLLPGLCHALQQQPSNNPMAMELMRLVSKLQVPRLDVMDETMKGFSIPDMALSHVQANATVWKSYDLPDRMLMDILQHSSIHNKEQPKDKK